MGKISKLLKALTLIVKQPALLNKVLDDEDVNRTEVIRKFGLTEGLPVISYPSVVPVKQVVAPYCAMEGGSTPIDLALLKGLASSKKDCDYFEIGTWRGESAANVAAVSRTCTTLNLPDSTLLEMGFDKRYVALHRFFSKGLSNVTHLFGNSLKYDFSSLEKKFDLIFIDGDHHFESVKSDTMNAFKLMKDENSVIVWHDYGHDPSNIRWDVLRGIMEGTPEHLRKNLYRVSNTLCAVYMRNAPAAEPQKAFTDPRHFFSIEVDCQPLR
jgi:predicted O-methyltransferase YrrM